MCRSGAPRSPRRPAFGVRVRCALPRHLSAVPRRLGQGGRLLVGATDVDCLAPAPADLDLPRARLLLHRNRDREYPVVVVRLHAGGIEILAQVELATEPAMRSFA